MAMDVDLDLVEVAPSAKPPVARILDYSKFVYEKKRRVREARKNQKKIEMKTIKLTLKTADFHRGIQIRKARGWLEESKKVKVEIRFHGREITYPELGRKIMQEVIEELQGIAIVEQKPLLEGRNMVMMLTLDPNYKPPVKSTPKVDGSAESDDDLDDLDLDSSDDDDDLLDDEDDIDEDDDLDEDDIDDDDLDEDDDEYDGDEDDLEFDEDQHAVDEDVEA